MDAIISAVLVMAVLGTTTTVRPTQQFAKDWGEDERAAWSSIEKHWEHITKGEVEEFLSYIHPEFTGFGHESPLLIDKESIEHWVGHWGENIDIPIYELQPLSVRAFDNFAIVNYYLFALERHGKEMKRFIRRYTTTMINEKGKWLVVGNQNALMPTDW